MRVLVIGAGAYVTGRGTGGPGTVLPALAEASRTLPLDEVTICATRADDEAEVAAATARVDQALGVALRVRYRRAAESSSGPIWRSSTPPSSPFPTTSTPRWGGGCSPPASTA